MKTQTNVTGESIKKRYLAYNEVSNTELAINKAWRHNFPLCLLVNDKEATKLPTTPKLSKRAIKHGKIPTIIDKNANPQASTKLKK
ncbi:MAG: hypothetical protein ACJAXJ_004347 [Colwellia sp.]|jgi:hypothetical protein